MIKLYHRQGSRSERVIWLMEELQIKYELENVERGVGSNPNFRDMNPLGRVPVMLDGHSPVFDSGAMLEYLLERFDKDNRFSPPRGSNEWRDYVQWMHGAETFLAPVTQYAHHTFIRAEADRVPMMATEGKATALENLQYLNQVLSARAYIAGARFSAADIMLGWGLLLMKRIGLIDGIENVEKYITTLEKRPAVRRISSA